MIHRILNKINNTTFNNAKLVVITLLFVSSLIYAFSAMMSIVYNSEYSRTLSFQSLKLDKSKKYLFNKEYKVSGSENTVVIPMGRVNMPDSLCTLYYDKEWKLKLTDNLRKNNKDSTQGTIFFPFCRLDEQINNKFVWFHNSIKKTPTQNNLLKGIRFNNASDRDPFVIKIEEKNNEYFLSKGLAFFKNRNVPITNEKKNFVELDFCINGDVFGDSKYIFSFPFFGSQNQPERKNIIIENNYIKYNETVKPIAHDIFTFSVNNCVFQLKNNYSSTVKYIVLPLLVLMIAFFSWHMLIRLYTLTSKEQNPRQKNLIKVEQFNILSLRILFNCIILLGFPILLLKAQESEIRLGLIAFAVFVLNINWINVINWLTKKVNIDNRIFHIISSFIVFVVVGIVAFFTMNELVCGKLPVLKATAIVFIFLPFAVSLFPEIRLIDTIKQRLSSADTEHVNKAVRDDSVKELKFNLKCYAALIISVGIIAFRSKDSATFIFTSLSLFLILIINFKQNIQRVWNFLKTSSLKEKILYAVVVIIIVFFCYLLYKFFGEKIYRLFSIFLFPDNRWFNQFPNLESSRETIAGQIFLLNSVDSNIKPEFNTIILPEFKSVFFSDYAVLWSFKIGAWFWFYLYAGVLLMLSYTILSLLIIFNKPIKLKTEKKSFYHQQVVFGLSLLLSLMLVQYMYTFFSNFWATPLTGQSPGLLSPAYSEYIFHIILINYLYVYLVSSIKARHNTILIDNDIKSAIYYIPAKFNTLVFLIIGFALFVWFLFSQQNKIKDYINSDKTDIEKKTNEMSWKIEYGDDLDSLNNLEKDTLLVSAHKCYKKIEGNPEEKRKFRNYLLAYYQSDNQNKKYRITTDYMKNNTNIDSIASIKDNVLLKEADVRSYSKYVNGNPTLFINNKYYGGCPSDAETVNFELQGKLNKELENWAVKINSKKGFQMVAGSIIVAENKSGYILASASYPLIYNENPYHILYENKKLNNILDNYKIGTTTEEIVIKYDNPKYINFSESDILPGSIVKPLLAYCGLQFLPMNYSQSWLNNFLGWSNNEKAEEIFTDLFVKGNYFEPAKNVYDTEFGNKFSPYTKQYNELKKALPLTHAIGQYQKLRFTDIVQAYMRIKTGRKIKLSYEKKEDLNFDTLSLDNEQLGKLRTAMCALRNGTAMDVGNTLKRKGVSIDNFLAKTGTAQIGKNVNYNRSSAIIVVGENITVGIQLYGVVPKNDDGLSAQYLCNELLKSDIIYLK